MECTLVRFYHIFKSRYTLRQLAYLSAEIIYSTLMSCRCNCKIKRYIELFFQAPKAKIEMQTEHLNHNTIKMLFSISCCQRIYFCFIPLRLWKPLTLLLPLENCHLLFLTGKCHVITVLKCNRGTLLQNGVWKHLSSHSFIL